MTDTSTDTAVPAETATSEVDRIPADIAEPLRATLVEPATEAVPDTAAPPALRRQSGWLPGLIIGALVAAGSGYAVQRYLLPQPVFDPSPLEARLTAAEAEAQGLRAEIARLSEAASTPAIPDQALLDRIAAIEARTAPSDAPLIARIDQLEANLAALANLPSETGVAPAALAALQAEMAALKSQTASAPGDLDAAIAAVETRLTEAEARAADLVTQANAIAATATRTAALGQIDAALDSGLPYRAALSQLGETEVPQVLTDHADTGLPTITSLRETFPDAARGALEQALRANTGASWTDRVATFLRNQTGARSLTPRDGTDPDAVLSRAEAALARADLPGALAELAALPPEAQTALADWTALAQLRLDARAALAGLLQAAGQ